MKKTRSVQKVFRTKLFEYDQYWNVNYTEVSSENIETDYKTIIKARSFDLAKINLIKRLLEDDQGASIKAVQGYMFHGNYKYHENKKLELKQWDQIKKASFPNENNILFKIEIPRPEGYSNRFNKTNFDHLKNIGFSKGKDNWSTINRKGKSRPLADRKGMIYSGHWIKWDKNEYEKVKLEIVTALNNNKNSRSKSAQEMGISRSAFYKYMKRIHDINWSKEYPYPKQNPPKLKTKDRSDLQKKTMSKMMSDGYVPFSKLTQTQKDLRVKNLRSSGKKKTKKRLDYWFPKIKEALTACNNNRKDSAEHLNITRCHFKKLMYELKDRIDWNKQYPINNERTYSNK